MAVDLNNLKEQIQTLLQNANTTTASRDLSSGLQDRVTHVLKVNPTRLPIQASFYPCVTVFVARKEVEQKTIAIDQMRGRRQAKVDVKIIGMVMNTIVTDSEVDEADEDCESLMENIEEILRANPTLNSAATWQLPTLVTYHNVGYDEEAHLRAGILNLQATIFY